MLRDLAMLLLLAPLLLGVVLVRRARRRVVEFVEGDPRLRCILGIGPMVPPSYPPRPRLPGERQ